MIHKELATIQSNQEIGQGIFFTSLYAPRIVRDTQPGQFVNLSPLADGSILNRPMAIYDTDPHTDILTICYHVVGANTKKYAALVQGDTIALIGPLGALFLFDLSYDRYILVGGGIGITSLNLIGKYLSSQGKHVTTLIGARSKSLIACEEDFKKISEVKIATDDGSAGYKGYINELLDQEIGKIPDSAAQVIYCGPHAMMKACAATCNERGVDHLAVMEEMMACGVGICVACVCQTLEGQKKVCIDGPIFDGSKIIWTREQTSVMHE